MNHKEGENDRKRIQHMLTNIHPEKKDKTNKASVHSRLFDDDQLDADEF